MRTKGFAKVSTPFKPAELAYIGAVTKEMQILLNAGLRSETAFEAALVKLDAKAEKLYQFLQKVAPKALVADDTPLSLHAEVASDAIGTNTVAKTGLAATLVERPLYSVALASATSLAAADGDDAFAFASSFTGAAGADFAYTRTSSVTGSNFQMSKEVMVALDFSFLELAGVKLTKDVSVTADRIRAEVGEGNVATAEVDLLARGEHTAVIADVSVVTIEDFFSSSAVTADLFIA